MNDRRHLPSPEQQDDILLLSDGDRDELPSDEYVAVILGFICLFVRCFTT